MTKDKTLKVSGKAVWVANGNKLEIKGVDGLVSVAIVDTSGSVLLIYHPLSGWYIEMDMREEG